MYRSKKEVTETGVKQNLKRIGLNIDGDLYKALQIIAEEENTFASEIVRKLISDFVENRKKSKDKK